MRQQKVEARGSNTRQFKANIEPIRWQHSRPDAPSVRLDDGANNRQAKTARTGFSST